MDGVDWAVDSVGSTLANEVPRRDGERLMEDLQSTGGAATETWGVGPG